ncbi:MAG TPA: GNAT family N-acetyltransferase [Caulobacteraceae bacterium]|nr:GNAT family N-acetyltransferase [Caulobacteraceae bacterium]
MLIEVVRPRDLRFCEIAAWLRFQAADPALETPFLTPDWAATVERAQSGRRGDIRIVVLREGRAPVGFFATRVVGQTAMPVGAPMCDYQGLVARPGLTVDPKRLVEALGVQRLDFSHMLADQHAFQPFSRGVADSFLVDVADGYAAYADARSGTTSILKDIAHRRRKLARERASLRFTPMADCPQAFERLLDWKRRQYLATGQPVIFDTPWTVELLRALHGVGGPDFGGALFTLHVGERVAAIQFHLRSRKTLHAWIIAHDPEFERYSPGLILFDEILRWMDSTPYATLDLGAGDYRFKHRFANARRSVSHGFVGRPSAASFMREAQYGVRAAAEKLPWPAVQSLPGKAMRRLDLLRGLR